MNSNYPDQQGYAPNQQGLAQGDQQSYAPYQQGYASNQQGMDYTVDMVFCIDATGSMESDGDQQQRIINMVKQNALNFYGDFSSMMSGKGKQVRQLRVRVVAFRDYLADGNQAMLVTDFFQLPQQADDFENCIKSISAMGGGDIPEDGLEALAYAIRSKWTTEGAKKRQVIVVWTDAGTHPIGYASSAPNYPKGMPGDMSELNDWWDEYMDFNSKRLIIFAPDEEGWSYISKNWDNVVHFPSVAGNGLAEKSYGAILDAVVNSIG